VEPGLGLARWGCWDGGIMKKAAFGPFGFGPPGYWGTASEGALGGPPP